MRRRFTPGMRVRLGFSAWHDPGLGTVIAREHDEREPHRVIILWSVQPAAIRDDGPFFDSPLCTRICRSWLEPV